MRRRRRAHHWLGEAHRPIARSRRRPMTACDPSHSVRDATEASNRPLCRTRLPGRRHSATCAARHATRRRRSALCISAPGVDANRARGAAAAHDPAAGQRDECRCDDRMVGDAPRIRESMRASRLLEAGPTRSPRCRAGYRPSAPTGSRITASSERRQSTSSRRAPSDGARAHVKSEPPSTLMFAPGHVAVDPRPHEADHRPDLLRDPPHAAGARGARSPP